MVVDRETDTLLREWNQHLQETEQKPLVMFVINKAGNVTILQCNDVTKEHIIDMCERIATIYRAK
jgi:hypothetical protein